MNFNYSLENLKTYNSRIKNFVKLEDKNFLKENELELIQKISSELNDKNCIQLFSNDVALLYLLRKKVVLNFILHGAFRNI